ncbi:calcineurin-like phosphoesterase C-terminal domain-containing protein [Runella sp.]|uniref:calcineurin-like phosphoesterase C-terminal domain-containing protein n=1 Tax=Runella sp. TaxID=1960881 RepID=UPI003D112A58
MKQLSLLLFLGLSISTARAQSIAKGYVFEDTNADNKKDKKEKGIANVAVSNGVEVVLTDEKGAYQLPVGDDNILFVIKPTGYKAVVNENNLPKFYYIHKPAGSPSLKYKGVAPTGPLPASVDFALTPSPENENFTALVFGDPQPYTAQDVDYFIKGIVREVQGIKDIPFGLTLGDLVGDNLELHQAYKEAVKKIGIPWYNLMGNHDMNYDATKDEHADEAFEAHLGPANYSFNYGKVHFIVLDNILYPDPRDGKGYWGGFRKDQLDFVENDLKFVSKDNLIVLAFHIPLKTEGESFRLEDRQRLFTLLKDFPNTLSLSAHTHYQQQNFFTSKEGWQQTKPHHEYNAGTTSGDWYSGQLNEQGVPISTMRDGTPKGYIFLSFKGNQYSIDYKVAGKPKEYQIDIFSPHVIPAERGTAAKIYANFFMGSKNDLVEYRIDNSEWKPMTLVEEVDPKFMSQLYLWDTSDKLIPGRRPSNPVKSGHLWAGSFFGNHPEGTHTIEVRAKDMFGHTFTQTKTYLVEQAPK